MREPKKKKEQGVLSDKTSIQGIFFDKTDFIREKIGNTIWY